ncbi:MAG TPA: zinc-dependent alcohol dehydrogenase family protein [Anaerolineaceae bacterium]|jgi:propanol-preferring alcohol dehydrogenase
MEIPRVMRAMVLETPGQPLRLREVPVPQPGPEQVLIRVHTCGVCRTDLHIVDGELPNPNLPLIPGHEIVGTVAQVGAAVTRFRLGDRVGVPWLGWVDGACKYCLRGQENLCEHPRFTGYTIDGGYAEYTAADHRFCFPIPARYADAQASPLLCAGLIGYRSYRLAGEHFSGGSYQRLGLYGFGAAAHILAQIAIQQGKEVYAFTSPGDTRAQAFARRLGAVWAGASTERPPARLDAAIIFAPVGPLVVEALKALDRGGIVVCGGIHMSDIPSFPYRILWEERVLRSVANLTRQDGDELLAVVSQAPVEIDTEIFPLEQANEAISRLRAGQIEGAAVLKCKDEG